MTIITYRDSASMAIYSARKRKMFAPVLEKITVNNFCIFFLEQVSGLRSLYGKIATFPKIRELEIEDESLEKVYDLLCTSGVTLREIRDITLLSYNQIRAIIALFINGYEL